MQETDQKWLTILEDIVEDLAPYYPKAILLFGSLARQLNGQEKCRPNDIDILHIGNNVPLIDKTADYGVPVELNHVRIDEITDIAKALRYDSKPVALSKLYGKMLFKHHALPIIAASLLLGPTYNEFGIEQILIDARIDTRDYSIHRILYGREWWARFTRYARERRGLLQRYSDRLVMRYEFDP